MYASIKEKAELYGLRVAERKLGGRTPVKYRFYIHNENLDYDAIKGRMVVADRCGKKDALTWLHGWASAMLALNDRFFIDVQEATEELSNYDTEHEKDKRLVASF